MSKPEEPLRNALVDLGQTRRSPRLPRGEGSTAPSRAEVATAMAAAEGMMAVTSLERAVSGDATIGDVGALAWLVLRTVVPATSMAIFVSDPANDAVVARYAAGAHTVFLHEIQVQNRAGAVGWTAASRRTLLNADPAKDLGTAAATFDPPLLSCAAVPLVYDGCLLGVLALYASIEGTFTSHHQRLLELLAPSLAVSVATVVEAPQPVCPAPTTRTRPTHLRLVQ
jgi:transcriptional regulator with GAF, ATPase, and Fis domain